MFDERALVPIPGYFLDCQAIFMVSLIPDVLAFPAMYCFLTYRVDYV
jgi:hypothetical protein